MTAPVAHRVMAEMGVRFNDFGTFARANRFKPRVDGESVVVPDPAHG
jgi:hypothetical protein